MTAWRILVADDDPLVLRMIREILTTLPASVLEARDGEEALHLARAEHPDLVLLDVMMPKLDGFQVASILKQERSTADIPLIFFSALASARNKVRGLDIGAEDYLAKPLDPDELKVRVRMVLRRIPPSSREAPLASGRLDAMNLLSLVQLFEGERRTARLLLTRGEEQAEIVFVDGRITQAIQGPRQGEAAVYRVLAWQDGTFQMAPPDASRPPGESVRASNQSLLMEGVRRLDEIPGLREGLLEPKVVMEVTPAFRTAIQSQARPEVTAVVALLDGSRQLDEVLAESPLDAWATLKILHKLLGSRALVSSEVSADRRSGPRLNVEVPIEYQSIRSFQKTGGFHLSTQGVFIRTAVPFDLGEQVLLRFEIPGQARPVYAMGQVVWQNADPSKRGGMGMGLRFLDLAAADREAIEGYLTQALAAQISIAGEKP